MASFEKLDSRVDDGKAGYLLDLSAQILKLDWATRRAKTYSLECDQFPQIIQKPDPDNKSTSQQPIPAGEPGGFEHTPSLTD
jgi:hypothetical protein